MSTTECFICEKTLENGEIVRVEQGVANLITVSKIRKDDKHKLLENIRVITVHKICRREYIKDRNIRQYLQKGAKCSSDGNKTTLRSVEQFDFQNKCLFCAEKCDSVAEAKKTISRRHTIFEIRSLTVKDRILQRCADRDDDESQAVLRRVNSVMCLVAAEARYHNSCYSKLLSNTPSSRKRGRPQDEELSVAFRTLCEFIDNSDEWQFTLQELMKMLKEDLTEGSSMTLKTLQNKLMEEYGDGVVFSTMRKRPTVVCFRGSGMKLISKWYTERAKSGKGERLRIVEATATIIREDIRTTAYDTFNYPDLSNFTNEANELVPETLRTFLHAVIMTNKKTKGGGIFNKCTAIAHSIISATRPRSFLSPILLGLGTYLFRKVASKNFVQAVSNLGFCSSYNEVSQLEYSAVQSWKPDIDKKSFSQFSFDNADINVNTIDGKGTFHAMGGIHCVTPHDAVRDSKILKLTSAPSGTTMGTGAQLQLQTFQRQNVGIEDIPLHNVYSKASFDRVAQPSSQDAIWMYGKFLHPASFPSWQGFMDSVTHTLPYTKSRIIALAFLNHPPSNFSTIFSVLTYAVEETKKLSARTAIVTFDQPLYMKASDIIASENEGIGLNVIVRLGGFHLLMSFLGSIGYIMGSSGLSELWSKVYAAASVPHMLSGHAYARALRAHFLTYSALCTLMLEEIPIEEEEIAHSQVMLADFNETVGTFHSIDDDSVVRKLKMLLSAHIIQLGERGPTARLWVQYHSLITIVMHFIEPERMGNWELHVDCVRAMLPIFHATGHFPYAKACQLYLQDMDSLQEKMTTEEFVQFTEKGFFAIRRTEKHWCGVWSDMTIEQTLMGSMKSAGGITHGRGVTKSVLQKWIYGLPVAYHVCESMERFCGIETSSSYQHVELRDARIAKDAADGEKFLLWFREHSPFIISENLVSLSSGLVAEASVNCHRSREIGERVLDELVKGNTKFGNLKLKRSNMAKSMSAVNNTMKISDNCVIQVDTTQLLQRIICTIHSPRDLGSCFTYELATIPLSIFDDKKLMRKTKKSSLYAVFDAVPGRPLESGELTYVLDGGNLLHRVVWPQHGTFSDIYNTYVNFIRKRYRQCVTVVFDGYSENEDSTKSIERQQRLLKRISAEIIFNKDTPISDSQKNLLSNLANKGRFIGQLMNTLESAGISTLAASDDADSLIVQTAINAANNSKKPVVVVGQDIDLLALHIALSPPDKDIRFLRDAQGKIKERAYSSHDLQNSTVVKDCRHAVLFAHAFSGCDATSAFFGKGKAQTVALKRCESV